MNYLLEASFKVNKKKRMGLKESLHDVSPLVYVLVMLFGVSSWIDINGIFVELPLMVNVLPEGWDLPSYISLIIQVCCQITRHRSVYTLYVCIN